MSNVIHFILDVLATSPEKLDLIAARLKRPSIELLDWVGKQHNCKPDEIVHHVEELVDFEPSVELWTAYRSAGASRRFSNGFRDKCQGVVKSHLFEVSQEFPNAVFLLKYLDQDAGYSGKKVIHAGQVLQEVFDGKDWFLLDIFAPY